MNVQLQISTWGIQYAKKKKQIYCIWLKNTSLLLVEDDFFAKSRFTDPRTAEKANKEKYDNFLAG